MLEALVLVAALLVLFPVVGAVTARWVAVVAPLVAWPLFYEGVRRGWWLYGAGESWQEARAYMTAIGFATTTLAVLVARGTRRRRMAVG